jgi:hypothetical protein
LVDAERTPLQGLLVQGLDRGIGLGVVRHLNEAEALGLAGELVSDQVGGLDLAVGGKGVAELVLGHAVGQVANIDIHQSQSLKKTVHRKKDPSARPMHTPVEGAATRPEPRRELG